MKQEPVAPPWANTGGNASDRVIHKKGYRRTAPECKPDRAGVPANARRDILAREVRFNDPWNPSRDEVLQWAYDENAFAPTQDFDLALSWCPGLETLTLKLANEDACPKRQFFLAILYLMIGDAVRSRYHVASRSKVEHLLEQADAYEHESLRRWQSRARELLEHPDRFDYDTWCRGAGSR